MEPTHGHNTVLNEVCLGQTSGCLLGFIKKRPQTRGISGEFRVSKAAVRDSGGCWESYLVLLFAWPSRFELGVMGQNFRDLVDDANTASGHRLIIAHDR